MEPAWNPFLLNWRVIKLITVAGLKLISAPSPLHESLWSPSSADCLPVFDAVNEQGSTGDDERSCIHRILSLSLSLPLLPFIYFSLACCRPSLNLSRSTVPLMHLSLSAGCAV